METKSRIDILALLLFLLIAVIGLASVYSATSDQGVFSLFEGRSGKQLMWLSASIFFGVIIFLLNANSLNSLKYFGEQKMSEPYEVLI